MLSQKLKEFLRRALSPRQFQATLAKEMDEYSRWLHTNVSSARQDHVRAFADDLGDLLALKQADVEESPALDLASWPAAARIRFVRAWRELKFPDGYSSESSSINL